MQIVTVPIRPWFLWNHFRPVRSTQILTLHCPSWGSYEPLVKARTWRWPMALHLSLCGLGAVPGSPYCFRDALFWSLVCPPGCGLLLFSYVPHSLAPPLMGIDMGLTPYGRCAAKESHLQCRNPTTSQALDIIALCKVGVDVHLTSHGRILHGEIYMQHKLCNTVVMLITDIYGTFATGQALCSVLHVDLKHLVLTTTL